MASPTPEQAFFDLDAFARGKRVLDVGCGDHKKVAWATGIDRVKTAAADIVHELDVYPWPIADGSFDLIVASHVVEHVSDVLRFFEELHRISAPGAQIRIATPHFTSPDAFADPTHKHQLGYRSLEFLMRPEDAPLPPLQRAVAGWFGMEPSVAGWYVKPRFRLLDRRITFRKPHRLLGLDRFTARLPLVYEYFLGGFAPARDLLFTLEVTK